MITHNPTTQCGMPVAGKGKEEKIYTISGGELALY